MQKYEEKKISRTGSLELEKIRFNQWNSNDKIKNNN